MSRTGHHPLSGALLHPRGAYMLVSSISLPVPHTPTQQLPDGMLLHTLSHIVIPHSASCRLVFPTTIHSMHLLHRSPLPQPEPGGCQHLVRTLRRCNRPLPPAHHPGRRDYPHVWWSGLRHAGGPRYPHQSHSAGASFLVHLVHMQLSYYRESRMTCLATPCDRVTCSRVCPVAQGH